ncbi:MAG: PAS domain S-box protein [Bacteroidota bacterium]
MFKISKYLPFKKKYAALELISRPIIVVDRDGYVIFANNSYLQCDISKIISLKDLSRKIRIRQIFNIPERELKKIYSFLKTSTGKKGNILYVNELSGGNFLRISWAHGHKYIIDIIDVPEIETIRSGNFVFSIKGKENSIGSDDYSSQFDINTDNSFFEVLDSLDDLIHITDSNHVIKYMNPSIMEIYGNAVGEKCYRVFNESDSPCPGCKLKLVMNGNSVRYEMKLKKNGITYDIINSPITLAGSSLYKISIMRDLNYLMDQHKWLNVFENAIEKSRNLVSIFSKDGEIQYANNAFLLFFEINNDELQNQTIYNLLEFGPGQLEHMFTNFEISPLKYGERHVLRVFIYPLFSNEEAFMSGSFVCIAHDITDIKNLEESLEKERNYFKSIIDNSTDGFFVINRKNHLVDCNQSFRLLFDITDDEIINKLNISDLFDKKSRSQLLKKVSTVFRTHNSENLEVRVTINNIKRYFLVSINHLSSQSGTTDRVYGFLKEITEITKLNNIIIKERNYNRNIIETVNLGFVLLNENNEYIDYNDAFLDIIGGTEKDLKGKTIFDFTLPEFRTQQYKILKMISQTGLPVIFEKELLRIDGKKVDVQVSMSRLVNPDGTLVGNFAFIRDITEQKKIEKELKKQNNRIINLIDSYTRISTQFMKSDILEDLIANMGRELISIVKPDNIEIFIRNEERFISQFSHDSFLKISDIVLSEKTSLIIQKLVNTRKMIFIEDTVTELNDEDIELLPGLKNYKSALFVPIETSSKLSAIIIMAFKERPEYFDNIVKSMLEGITNLASITIEKIRSIEEQESMQEALDRYEKLVAIGRIIAGVAHEINNPLSIMQLDLEELKDASETSGNSTPEIIELITSLQDEIRRISGIVKQLKDYSKPASLQNDEIVMDEILKTYPLKILIKNIQKKGINIIMRLNSGKSKILMPKTRIIQIMMNILTNADDAIEDKSKGIIRIGTSVVGDDQKYVAISVIDNGSGIQEENLHKIFEPFFTTKKKEGTGLGLSITYSIIKNYNGDLKIESTPGIGSEFTIYIPEAEK